MGDEKEKKAASVTRSSRSPSSDYEASWEKSCDLVLTSAGTTRRSHSEMLTLLPSDKL